MARILVPRPEKGAPGQFAQLIRPLELVFKHCGVGPGDIHVSAPRHRVDRFAGMIRVRDGEPSTAYVGGMHWREAWLIETTDNGGRESAHWREHVVAGRTKAPAPWVYGPADRDAELGSHDDDGGRSVIEAAS